MAIGNRTGVRKSKEPIKCCVCGEACDSAKEIISVMIAPNRVGHLRCVEAK